MCLGGGGGLAMLHEMTAGLPVPFLIKRSFCKLNCSIHVLASHDIVRPICIVLLLFLFSLFMHVQRFLSGGLILETKHEIRLFSQEIYFK